MTENTIEKRRFYLKDVPTPYLLEILNKMKIPEQKIINDLKPLLGRKIKKIENMKKVSHSIIEELFIQNNYLTTEKEEELFIQFRDSRNPSFYFYKLDGEFADSIDDIIKKIDEIFHLVDLDRTCHFSSIKSDDSGDLLKYKRFKIKLKKPIREENIIEVHYEYLERIDYIDENYNFCNIYSMSWGFFWIDLINKLAIIKEISGLISEAIIQNFAEKFNCSYYKFYFSKEIIDSFLDANELIKISLKNIDPNAKNAIQNVILSDIHVDQKVKNEKLRFLLEYDRTLSKYFTEIPGFNHKSKVTISQSGKIALNNISMNIESCRKWLILVLSQVLNHLGNFSKNNDIIILLNSNDIFEKSEIVKQIKSEKSRQILKEIIQKIIKLKERNQELDSEDLKFPFELSFFFSNYTKAYLKMNCEDEECGLSLRCLDTKCSSTTYSLKKDMKLRRYIILCEKCGTEIGESSELSCPEDHITQIKHSEMIMLIFNYEFKLQINKLFQDLKIEISINFDKETIYIQKNRIYRIWSDRKTLFSWDELPAFRMIKKIDNMSDIEKKNYALEITKLLEKCKTPKDRCRGCLTDNHTDLCISRVFAKISKGVPHPHSGLEFGDFSFPQNFLSQREEIIGIAKSYRKPQKNQSQNLSYGLPFGLLTFRDNDNLLEQFMQICDKDSVKFIMVVSGRIIEPSLRHLLISHAGMMNKKIVIIGPDELIPILYYYRTSNL